MTPMNDVSTADKIARSIVCFRPNSAAKLRLFCFPYAGGGSLVYRGWLEHFEPAVELCAIQYPGRENRIKEAPIERLPELIKWLVPDVLRFSDLPFAFFGHSLGALIAFELMRRLRREYALVPRRLFVSAHGAPHRPRDRGDYHKLPDAELVERLRKNKGSSDAVLDNAELMRLILPRLRADFALCETYVHQEEPPFAVPITVFGGTRDSSTPYTALQDWQKHTTGEFQVELLDGDHFFIHSAEPELLQQIKARIDQWLETERFKAQDSYA
jgi:medium-chain acyl-[acyl-carrier-protein] hydrolase